MAEDTVAVTGPIPPGEDPDTYDRLRRRVLWSMPSGLYLVGSAAGGQANLMTTNWVTQVATAPKTVAVAVEAGALTHRLIEEGGAFSVNILARTERAVVRRFVKPAQWDAEASTLNGFPVRTEATGAPIFAGAVGWMDCRVVRDMALGSHTLFIGEIAHCGQNQPEGSPVLRMEDTRMNYGG